MDYYVGEFTRTGIRPANSWYAAKTNFTDMRDVIVMPGAGHTPPEERPDEVNAVLLRFLADIGFSLLLFWRTA